MIPQAKTKMPPHPTPTESIEQQCLFRWAQFQSGKYPELSLMYHVPNEGKRSRGTGGRMRAEGLKSGVPDICLPVPRGVFHGLYIELKRTQGGKVTGNQSYWLAALEQQGYCAAVCEGWEAAAEVIADYIKRDKPATPCEKCAACANKIFCQRIGRCYCFETGETINENH